MGTKYFLDSSLIFACMLIFMALSHDLVIVGFVKLNSQKLVFAQFENTSYL